jgi:hypothetical protein
VLHKRLGNVVRWRSLGVWSSNGGHRDGGTGPGRCERWCYGRGYGSGSGRGRRWEGQVELERRGFVVARICRRIILLLPSLLAHVRISE